MAKKVTTISISIPVELAEELDSLCLELNVKSRSTLVSVLISMALKWIYKAKEVI